ncbi:MAG: hypothetical protein WD065_01745 [Planctomycetaceae bacterium]
MRWILASWLAVGLIGPTVSAHAQQGSSGTLYTNKARFRIPFRFDAEEIRRLNAREIRLFVSFDRGVTWQQSQAVDAQTGRFDFQAPADGEYWFSVQTIDGLNKPHPPSDQLAAGLQVVVDSTAPEFDIKLQSLPGGKVGLKWKSFDANLDTKSLQLEFIQSGDNQWHAVNVLPLEDGETSWSVAPGSEVAVRGSIQDQAGNVATAQAQVRIENEPAAAPRGPAPDFSQPIANGHAPSRAEPQTKFEPQAKSNSYPPVISPRSSDRPEVASADPKTAESIDSPLDAAPVAPAAEAVFPSNPFSQDTVPLPEAPNSTPYYPRTTPTIADASPAAEDALEPIQPGETLPSASAVPRNSLVRDLPQFRPDVTKGRYAKAEEKTQPAGKPRVRVINNLRFNIGYRIEDVGPSGVSAVELFITQDGGVKWYKYGEDPDRQSPFQVEVPEAGSYGFAIRVHSGVGLSNDPPQPGEKPVIEVQIDQTAPQVQFLPIEQGKGNKLNQITIRWQAEDDMLGEKPIAISYASNPQGPWESITGWMENSGSHTWTVGAGVPAKIYLQITARDAAGNINQTVTPQPIVVDMSRPSARIVDVESLDDAGSPF